MENFLSVYPDSTASRWRHAADQAGDKSGCFAREEEERVGREKEEGGRGDNEGPEFQRVLLTADGEAGEGTSSSMGKRSAHECTHRTPQKEQVLPTTEVGLDTWWTDEFSHGPTEGG